MSWKLAAIRTHSSSIEFQLLKILILVDFRRRWVVFHSNHAISLHSIKFIIYSASYQVIHRNYAHGLDNKVINFDKNISFFFIDQWIHKTDIEIGLRKNFINPDFGRTSLLFLLSFFLVTALFFFLLSWGCFLWNSNHLLILYNFYGSIWNEKCHKFIHSFIFLVAT